jgi:hypothetical protein
LAAFLECVDIDTCDITVVLSTMGAPAGVCMVVVDRQAAKVGFCHVVGDSTIRVDTSPCVVPAGGDDGNGKEETEKVFHYAWSFFKVMTMVNR